MIPPDNRYTDLIQEIKERLYVIEDVLSSRTSLQGVLAHEFCFLQLRMICECIAFACVVAHGYIKETTRKEIKSGWSAEQLIKELNRLHQDFYPEPRSMSLINDGWHLGDITPNHLTKADLIFLNGICGSKVHRGTAKNYDYSINAERLADDRRSIIEFGDKIFRLMESHLIRHRDEPRYIICRFRERDAQVDVAYAGPS